MLVVQFIDALGRHLRAAGGNYAPETIRGLENAVWFLETFRTLLVAQGQLAAAQEADRLRAVTATTLADARAAAAARDQAARAEGAAEAVAGTAAGLLDRVLAAQDEARGRDDAWRQRAARVYDRARELHERWAAIARGAAVVMVRTTSRAAATERQPIRPLAQCEPLPNLDRATPRSAPTWSGLVSGRYQASRPRVNPITNRDDADLLLSGLSVFEVSTVCNGATITCEVNFLAEAVRARPGHVLPFRASDGAPPGAAWETIASLPGCADWGDEWLAQAVDKLAQGLAVVADNRPDRSDLATVEALDASKDVRAVDFNF